MELLEQWCKYYGLLYMLYLLELYNREILILKVTRIN